MQGSPAFLEGRLPDRGGSRAHGHPVPADLRPRAGRPRAGLPRRGLHQLPDPGAGDDERAAEQLRQQQQFAGAEQDHRQPRVPAGHAAVALGLVRGLCRRVDGARAGGRQRIGLERRRTGAVLAGCAMRPFALDRTFHERAVDRLAALELASLPAERPADFAARKRDTCPDVQTYCRFNNPAGYKNAVSFAELVLVVVELRLLGVLAHN